MIYIDNAATTKRKPIGVIFSAVNEILHPANAGRGGHKASIRTALKIEKVRSIIEEKFFEGNVIFTKNCTEALNLAICGTKLYGQVVTSVYEHNSVLRTLRRKEKEGKIKLKIIYPENGDLLPQLKLALKEKTSMAVFSGMSNVTGEKIDISRLAETVKKMSNAVFVADLAQSAGHLDFDYTNVDIITCSGHKGLHGLQGSGFMLAKKNLVFEPLVTGGTGTSGNNLDAPKEIPEGLEAGTLNAIGIVSLGKGIEYTFKHKNSIQKRLIRYTKKFSEGLKKIDNVIVYSAENGIVLCNVLNKTSEETADLLSVKYGICVRGGIHCAPLIHIKTGTEKSGAVRFSFGINNNFLHVLYALFAMKKIAQTD